MKKAQYYIYGRFGENGSLGYKKVNGYLFSHENILFGVHKHDGTWTCTHIKSGLLVPVWDYSTRKAVVSQIEDEKNNYAKLISEGRLFGLNANKARLIEKMTEQYYKHPIKGMGVFFGIREEAQNGR